jgi:xanthosine utilization system XapX-like protein
MKIGEKNVGMTDRIVRIVLGLILIIVFALNYIPSPWSYLVALIGLILLVTGAVGTCGLYSVIGLNTLENKG